MLALIGPTDRSVMHVLSANGAHQSITPNINTLFRRLIDLGISIQHQLGMTTMRVLNSLYYDSLDQLAGHTAGPVKVRRHLGACHGS